jgi:hypothetical protein
MYFVLAESSPMTWARAARHVIRYTLCPAFADVAHDDHSMAAAAADEPRKERKRTPRTALDPLVADAGGPSRMEIVSRALLAPFTHRRNESNRMLSERACRAVAPSRAELSEPQSRRC